MPGAMTTPVWNNGISTLPQYSAAQCITVRRGAVQSSEMKCSVGMHYSTMQHMLQCSAVKCSAVHRMVTAKGPPSARWPHCQQRGGLTQSLRSPQHGQSCISSGRNNTGRTALRIKWSTGDMRVTSRNASFCHKSPIVTISPNFSDKP